MTVTYDLAEKIADGVAAYIEGAQATKLAAVDARYATAVGLTDFHVRVSDVDYAREPLDQFPLLFVSPQRARMEPPTAGLAHGAMTEHLFQFVMVHSPADSTTETTGERMKRWALRGAVAVLEMLVESYDATTRPWEWGTGDTTEIQYRTFTAATRSVSVAVIQATCLVAEDAA